MENLKMQVEKVRNLLQQQRFAQIRRWFKNTDPADVADILEELELDEVSKIFTMFDTETASEVIVEMEPGEIDDVVERIPPEKVADMISEMAPDDAADFFTDLDEDDQHKVYALLENETRDILSALVGYEEDSAGGLMTSELCAVPVSCTVEQAIRALMRCEFNDPITMIFAVDKECHLVGGIHISELISKNKKALIRDIVDKDIITARVEEDQEKIALEFRKYDLYVMPVLDDDGKLVGRITADDVMDVMDEEAVQDIAHMAGAPDIEVKEDSPMKIVRLRLPWLLITMLTGVLVSFVVKRITDIEDFKILAVYVPLILSMGGNTGIQATAVTVRSIALGEIEFNKLLGVFVREISVGAVMGAICGMLAGSIILLFFYLSGGLSGFELVRYVGVVAASMLTAMTFAAFSGSLLPIILTRLKIDPALASGPFVTTFNDLSASLIYLLMCYMLLQL